MVNMTVKMSSSTQMCCSNYARPVGGAVTLPQKYIQNRKQDMEHQSGILGISSKHKNKMHVRFKMEL